MENWISGLGDGIGGGLGVGGGLAEMASQTSYVILGGKELPMSTGARVCSMKGEATLRLPMGESGICH